ncbi:MAG: ATP-binding protein [Daejeonella sp.]
MSFELYSLPLLAFFLIRYLRRTLKTYEFLPEWDAIFKKALYAIVLLFTIEVIFKINYVTVWVWDALFIYLFWLTFTKDEFYITRTVMVAILPLVLISYVEHISKLIGVDFSKRIDNYLDYIYPIAFIWLFAMLYFAFKQRKNYDKEIHRKKQEKEHNLMMAEKKAELEFLVKERTAELTRQKAELEHTIEELHNTQTQLVQSEKMASLGELTAGIAHEIQNPLNFVNNFSEVSVELIDDMTSEIKKGSVTEVMEIAADIKENLLKISHHGKRADAIVKGMLQHSRSNSGHKEPTDLNALTDEYLRLSYHGLRAKDKSFNATMETHFDEDMGKVSVVPQDMGRVILNLLTNAFYSVNKKRNLNLKGYSPMVSVSTKRIIASGKTSLNGSSQIVEIRIRDNGSGIPKKVLDKIYQPFFTTKPTGEGTGLGLSLSYEIVKAHKGDLKVKTKEGEYAEFIIHLPA